jgi:putative peptide zinc metalloprotease protein
MGGYPLDAIVKVPPFASRREGSEVIIGRPERRLFLSVPEEGLDILQLLADGHTVGETTRRYQEKHAETPDIADFVGTLRGEGFLDEDFLTLDSPAAGPAAPVSGQPAGAGGAGRLVWHINFDWISPAVARRLCGPAVLALCAAIIACGVFFLADSPGPIPGVQVLFFKQGHFAVLTLAAFGIALVAVFIHEMAHAVVARASNAGARLAIGNLMYVLVAQTDITGIWLAPKRRRYLAFLAGTIVDLVGASVIIGILWAAQHHFIGLSDTVTKPLLEAVLFTYGTRIAFQFVFYIRTDFYYVLAASMNCTNLMADTETLLGNWAARLRRRPGLVKDMSGIPAREMRNVRIYAPFWLVGRVFAFGVLFFFFVPLMWHYLKEFVELALGQPHTFTVGDYVTVACLSLLVDGGGIVLWVTKLSRGWLRGRSARRGLAHAVSVPEDLA